jgi:3-hydroxyisobutyrate dehydrogenase
MKVGFIGFGTMGLPMAGHLLSAYGELGIWSRNPSAAEELVAKGAVRAATAKDLAAMCDVVVLCVNRTEDVQSLCEELARGAKPGTLIIDHSTISPRGAKEIEASLRKDGFRFVDAPITGGSMGAQSGQLTIFVGGSENDCAEAIEVIKPYSKRAERVGGPGTGQMAKMANQIAVASMLMGLCECLVFAEKAGLDLEQMRDMIGGGAGGSWGFPNYGPRILKRDWSPGFSIKNQRKDFAYCREAASEIGAQIPATLLVDNLLQVLQDEGRGEEATTALFEILERNRA